MASGKLFVLFLILFQSSYSLSRSLEPIRFEFHHRESLVISEEDDDVEEDYDYEDPITTNDSEQEDRHVRKRRSAQWSPDYDLYEQWAEEYYDQDKKAAKAARNIQPVGDLLDRLINAVQNRTKEELEEMLEQEREARRQRVEMFKSILKYSTYVIGVIIIYCCVSTMIKRCLNKFLCGFCNAFKYKDKITQLVNNFVPGVYVHKNGKKEFYVPTEEELEALKEIQKILFSVT